MDNQILIFGAQNRFRLNKKKIFKGHMVAGYACQVDFSPDMRYNTTLYCDQISGRKSLSLSRCVAELDKTRWRSNAEAKQIRLEIRAVVTVFKF